MPCHSFQQEPHKYGNPLSCFLTVLLSYCLTLYFCFMQSKSNATTPEEYIENLPEDRRDIMRKLRKVILKNLPKGFKEGMGYGMIGYVVPHTLYKPGYHVDPKQPLMFMALASQKNHIALYHMGLYGGAELDWFNKEWPKHTTKKLDMGKSCIRFKKPEDVPLDLIGELCTRMTPQQWIECYESNLKRSRK